MQEDERPSKRAKQEEEAEYGVGIAPLDLQPDGQQPHEAERPSAAAAAATNGGAAPAAAEGTGGPAVAVHEAPAAAAEPGAVQQPGIPPEHGGGAGAALPPADGATLGEQPPAPDAKPVVPLADTYANREARHTQREADGELGAHHVTNDGSAESGILLAGLRAVFSKCLPNMPREYISRLLFERRHRSVVIVRHADKRPPADGSATGGGSIVPQVIGGITYRPFGDRRFAEIAFCAVAQSLQVSGYGTRLMNWTKHYARERDGCEYFLTYADNNAVGYFSKQGFTKQVTMDKERWFGYIKDYDGGTLMECRIHPTLPFTGFQEMVRAQRGALDAQVRLYTSGHVVHPGIGRWKEGRGGPVPIESIPGVIEAGWTPAVAAGGAAPFRLALGGALVEATRDNLQAFMESLLRRLLAEDSMGPWLAPVKEEEAPGYHAVVKDPIDLGLIGERLASRAFYISLEQFVADVCRCFNNSKLFNSSDNWYHKAAHRHLAMFQGWVDASVIAIDV